MPRWERAKTGLLLKHEAISAVRWISQREAGVSSSSPTPLNAPALTLELVYKAYDIPRIQELALSAISQSVIIADANHADVPIIFANEAFVELTGYALDEVVGRNCRFLQGLDTSPDTREQIRAAIAARQPFSGLILNYRKDGSAFWNDLSLTPINDGEMGRFVIGVQRDVTEQLDLEARLRESQRMEAIGKLSGGIAHDFNNILALILGNAEIIAAEADDGSLARDAANDIMDAADGGSKLIARMLQYTRGEGGENEEVPINEVIEALVTLLSRTIGEPVRLETDLSPAVGRVTLDRTLFESALLNLALNARDAMPSGGTIHISSRRRANAGPTLGTAAVIAVSDSGVGMDDATKSRAFEPFFTTKHAGRGNGLGLAMVYNFVKQSGGDVSIETAPDRGTTVSMVLPISEPMIRSAASEDEAPHVLIVEDDAKVRQVLSVHLARGGFAVDQVSSGEEALALIDSGLRPAMLVSDIRLRERMTGVELVSILQERSAKFPMLLMTGFADELEENADHIRSVPVLRKPFRSATLLAEVNRMIAPQAKRSRP